MSYILIFHSNRIFDWQLKIEKHICDNPKTAATEKEIKNYVNNAITAF